MEATSLPALGSLMARQICFLPGGGGGRGGGGGEQEEEEEEDDDDDDNNNDDADNCNCNHNNYCHVHEHGDGNDDAVLSDGVLACDNVPAHEVFEIIGTEVEYGREGHGIDGALTKHVRCSHV